MKKRGLTLVELVVVIALLAILAVVLAPRLRDQVAKSRDAKAIAILGALRGASEAYHADSGEITSSSVPTTLNIFNVVQDDDKSGLDRLVSSLNQEAKTMFKVGRYSVEIGGVRESSEGAVSYGERIGYTFHAPAGSTADGIMVWFTERVIGTANGRYDTKGNRWVEY